MDPEFPLVFHPPVLQLQVQGLLTHNSDALDVLSHLWGRQERSETEGNIPGTRCRTLSGAIFILRFYATSSREGTVGKSSFSVLTRCCSASPRSSLGKRRGPRHSGAVGYPEQALGLPSRKG